MAKQALDDTLAAEASSSPVKRQADEFDDSDENPESHSGPSVKRVKPSALDDDGANEHRRS